MITHEQQDALRELGMEYPDHTMAKFCERPSEWYAEAMHIAVGLGLDRCASCAVFDVGGGFGYFVRACRDLGHDATGLDLPNILIAEAAHILGVPFYASELRPFRPLAALPERFDLITTFGVNFRRYDKSYWGADEYAFLTRDVFNHLKPGGRWVLRPNHPYTWDVEKWVGQIEDFADVRINGGQITVRPKESNHAND